MKGKQMKPSRIAIATLGVGAALTAGAWTLSAAAVPLPTDQVAIPVVVTSQPLIADPGVTAPAASDPTRAVADAEARLLAINDLLQALAVQQAPTASAAGAPAVAGPADVAVPTTAAAPPAHTVSGASGSTSAGENSGAEHDSENQDD